jgi:hypothetical protein
MDKKDLIAWLIGLEKEVEEMIDSLAGMKDEERKPQAGDVYIGISGKLYIILDPNGSRYCVDTKEVRTTPMTDSFEYVGKFSEVFHTTEEVEEAAKAAQVYAYDTEFIDKKAFYFNLKNKNKNNK